MSEHPFTFEQEKNLLKSRNKSEYSSDRVNRIARHWLFKLLAHAKSGHLIFKENNQRVAEFGNPDDSLSAEINVTDARFYSRVLLGGSCAAGETYIEQWWATPNLTFVIQFFARNLSTLDRWEKRFSWLLKPVSLIRKYSRNNGRKQAKRNILAHYDLGNELYEQLLDEQMQYSSALFSSGSQSLAEAQHQKMHRLCQQLQLNETDHLLEIGSGWGGLAIFAARHYGCRVTTTTISDAQFSYAKEAIEAAGLSDQIELLNKDYRELQGHYDKIVSVEMIEAVGERYLPQFFKSVNQLLKPGGKLILQAITIADQRYHSYASGEDFIQKYIFPGGFLPSVSIMSQLISEHTNLVVRDLHDMGLDYARTLASWRDNLLSNQRILAAHGYDERFIKLWLFYLAYCEGGFLERRISTVQLLASKSH